MTSFTDDDLKRLKENLDNEFGGLNKIGTYALLARLEAAEDYIGALTTGSGIKTAHLFEEAWRKAAGK